ncbi:MULTISPECIES: hypothetical protein [Halobacterium]|uniref:hypothetical protein n=1 Tax=Halobacterium TaxID=2239 RepID=UPI0019666948|nr:hypothetical protein [Halobacterium sp. BOL4-2]QRY26368.1 hypothetical protein JRZ79_13035 [Halobacterium sp. BOL4-2]
MKEDTEGEISREPPDPDQLKSMRDSAVNSNHLNRSTAQQEVRAQILQTQQLNYDVHLLNEELSDLNSRLKSYTTWSRRLTLVLIVLGLLQLAFAAIQIGVI